MDYYWSVVDLNRNRQLSSGLVKSYTKLGPLLSGPNAPYTKLGPLLSGPRVLSTSVDQKAINADTDSVVRRLLALDPDGLDEDRDTADSEINQQYYNTVQHKEYLQALAQRSQIRSAKQQSAARQPHVGDVILIQTDNTSRSNWPLGLIVKINSSAHGSVRSVGVKTGKNKLLDRSVNQLIPLEVVAEDTALVKTKKQPGTPTRIQPPRKAKKTFIR
ncbi:unnamed protein product [Heligmosomoides polygyrus]|uniref:DUF5641 domain-containing protein n=1 Tax=Heligmosomoides polygyrus TaxID=6339 RepID=A0A183F682_HELPZ|nr:unnamed protein product [Heligmosomoides polygyrus]